MVGDELLSGSTRDTNTYETAKALTRANVVLKRVVVVPDHLVEISRELRSLSASCDVVITSGAPPPRPPRISN